MKSILKKWASIALSLFIPIFSAFSCISKPGQDIEIYSGSCSVGRKYDYSFEFINSSCECKRWPLKRPEEVEVVKIHDSEALKELCYRILGLEQVEPPLIPSSVPVTLKLVDGSVLYFNKDRRKVFVSLLTELENSFEAKR